MEIQILFIALILPSLAHAHGMSEAEIQTILEGGNLQFLKIGATHMLTGYDHLLFVFGIVFFLTTFMNVIKFITAFTIDEGYELDENDWEVQVDTCRNCGERV